MYSFDKTPVKRSCLVCGHEFVGARNRMYCSIPCQERAASERNYWPKVVKQLSSEGWFERAPIYKQAPAIDTPLTDAGHRHTMYLDHHAPISSLEKQCKEHDYPFPLIGWAHFEPGEIPVPMELVQRALEKYALCDLCGKIVLRADFIPSLGVCEHCVKDSHEPKVDFELKNIDQAAKSATTLREKVSAVTEQLDMLETCFRYPPDGLPF